MKEPRLNSPLSEPAPRGSFILPVLILLGCAAILTGGSFYGVAATCNFGAQNSWTKVFAVGALVGLAAIVLCLTVILLSAVWLVIKKIRGIQ